MIVFEYIEGIVPFGEKILANKQVIASYIQMLHNISIVHGDIKSDNFIDTGAEVYIIDFGCSFDANFDVDHKVKWKPCAAALEDKQRGYTHTTNKITD